ncbi:hypothetical protein [uncultured Tenacibaculum sp.]|uniref:hypothetical protein n=1 Tax=uncultured Tenacibaculum sp. TaxID=174713 RepID=UPI00260DAA53|nr:hypothetical protein [uncultured Tenacibaculum sp.]
MLEKFKSFQLNKDQQKNVKGSGDALVPNKNACRNSIVAKTIGLITLGSIGSIFGIGEAVHCD